MGYTLHITAIGGHMHSRITLEETRPIVAPRMEFFAKALARTIKAWNEDYVPAQMILDTTARAIILNQVWYHYASEELAGDTGVIRERNQNQRYFIIDERVIVRFKLLDNNFRARNYPTERAMDWVRQLPLMGLPRCERLHLGYRLDLTGNAIKDAFLTLPNGISNDWVWQIWGDPVDIFNIQLPLREPGVPSPVVYRYDDYSVAS
jgi:hypothetical protein